MFACTYVCDFTTSQDLKFLFSFACCWSLLASLISISKRYMRLRVRLLSLVTTSSLSFLKTRQRQGSTSQSTSARSRARCSCRAGGNDASHDVSSGRQPKDEGSRYTMPQRLTVAG